MFVCFQLPVCMSLGGSGYMFSKSVYVRARAFRALLCVEDSDQYSALDLQETSAIF